MIVERMRRILPAVASFLTTPVFIIAFTIFGVSGEPNTVRD